MKSFLTHPRFRRSGFSLIEILAVLVVVALLSAVVVSGMRSVARASTMNATLQQVLGELDAARQAASARNRAVEVRLYFLPKVGDDPTASPSVYRAMQTFLVDNGTTTALTKVFYLPPSIVISDDASHSTLTDPSQNPRQIPAADWVSLPSYQKNYQAAVFRFLPQGSLGPDLDASKQWYFSLFSLTGDSKDVNSIGTIQIDPMNGRATLYRK